MESTRASAPSVKFGSGSRDQANRLFISAEHEKCQVGSACWSRIVWPEGRCLRAGSRSDEAAGKQEPCL